MGEEKTHTRRPRAAAPRTLRNARGATSTLTRSTRAEKGHVIGGRTHEERGHSPISTQTESREGTASPSPRAQRADFPSYPCPNTYPSPTSLPALTVHHSPAPSCHVTMVTVGDGRLGEHSPPATHLPARADPAVERQEDLIEAPLPPPSIVARRPHSCV